MTSVYPTSIDAFATHANGDIINPDFDNEQQEAITALETKVGVTNSAVNTTLDYKTSEVTGGDKAVGKSATQTLTNKTLTSPVVNVGSDATGDMYYRNAGVLTRIPVGTDNQIMKLNGTTPNWEAEATTVDASTTVKGIVEAATSAEVTAGTATGGTGAVLVVTPDALAASTPVFNGGSITNISRLLNTVTTDVTYASSTAENTLLSYSVAGGTLSTSNVIRVTMHVTALAVTNTNTVTFRFKYGATTFTSPAFTATGAIAWTGKIEFVVAGAGTTSSQNGSVVFYLCPAGYVGSTSSQPSYFAYSTQGTAAIDSTSSQTLAVTAQHSNNSVNDNITVSMIVTEVIR